MAGNRNHVLGPEYGGLRKDPAAHFCQRQAVGGRIELLESSGCLDGLERHAADCRLRESEVDDGSNLVVVQPLLQGHHQSCRDSQPVEPFERTQVDAAEVSAPKRHQCQALERVELQVDLDIGHVLGQPRRECFVLRDPEAVGVHHQVTDRRGLRTVEDREEIRVDRRLATGDLYDVGLPLIPDDRVDQPLNVVDRPVLRTRWAAACVADGALQVAMIGDLDERDARVLLMIGAQPAVIRTAPLDGGVEHTRHLRRLDEHFPALPVVVHIVCQEHAFGSMRWARLEHVDGPVLKHDLGFDLLVAG